MRTGDRGEFEEVFRSAYPSVLRTAFLVLHDRGRAEEVTQDGFLRLYERWARAVTYDHPVAWVRKVVVRDAIRRAERERRQRPTLVLVDRGTSDRMPRPRPAAGGVRTAAPAAGGGGAVLPRRPAGRRGRRADGGLRRHGSSAPLPGARPPE